MPQPSPTKLDDVVGPIQSYPFHAALKECFDLNQKNTYWIFNEEEKKVMRLVIRPDQEKAAEHLYLGCRIVVFNKITYLTLAMSAKGKEPPEVAYDRAMAVIGRR